MSFSSNIPLTAVQQITVSIDWPKPEEPVFLDTISLRDKTIAQAVNTKQSGLYLLQETANFKQIFTTANPQVNRNAYRYTYNLIALNGGNIGAGATVAFAHNITGLADAVIVYCSVTDANNLRFTVTGITTNLDAVNLNFTNPSGVALTQAMFVAEYTKN